MLVSYRWLRELLPSLEAPVEIIADRLTSAGLEVESREERGEAADRVVVAEVREVAPHPSRSGLRLVTVDRGGVVQRVVCGAPNVPGPGGRVVLAPLGATLPAVGLTMAPREIGGVLSEGMLCSEVELGLADESDGLLLLPATAGAPGDLLSRALPESRDTILGLGVTPNRPDALGHVGVARELAALLGLDFAFPAPGRPKQQAEGVLSELVRVEIEDGERCPEYDAGAVLGVTVAPSPAWLRWRLHALGVRPISNVVDVTNWVLLGFGQPMHAFDLDRLRGSQLAVRRARQGEPFTTLDGVERVLDADDLLIVDGEGPVALAGVMGGLDSEIKPHTRRVLLESAYFTPRGVRRTSRRHSLKTEASFRFERGVDWGATATVLEHAKVLLSELAGGAVVAGTLRVEARALQRPRMRLRSKRLDALLGAHVPFEEATRTLARLGLEVGAPEGARGDEAVEVTGASWRPDLEREVDLIEEVARVRGLDAIPTVLPAIQPQTPRTAGKLERAVAELARDLGLDEALTYAFVSPRELAMLHAPEPVVTLMNPLTDERSVMRTSLLPGLLEALRHARRYGERSVRLYSVGARFLHPDGAAQSSSGAAARPRLAADQGVLPEERPSFAAVLAGARPGYLAASPEEHDIYDAKGLACALVERLIGRPVSVRRVKELDHAAHLHPRGAAELFVDEVRVGTFGPLHPDVVDALDLDGTAQTIELDLAALEALGKRVPRYRPVPRLPAVSRDLALVVSDDVPAGDVEELIRGEAGELCESVRLFDVFRGGALPPEHRSLAFRVIYRDPRAATAPDAARALTDKEVDERHARVVKVAAERLGAALRG